MSQDCGKYDHNVAEFHNNKINIIPTVLCVFPQLSCTEFMANPTNVTYVTRLQKMSIIVMPAGQEEKSMNRV